MHDRIRQISRNNNSKAQWVEFYCFNVSNASTSVLNNRFTSLFQNFIIVMF